MSADDASVLFTVAAVVSVALVACIRRRRRSSVSRAPEPSTAAPPERSTRRKKATPGSLLADAMNQDGDDLDNDAVWAGPPSQQPSAEIVAFPKHPCCWTCFAEEHGLNKGVVKRLYTNGKLEQLNATLAQAGRRSVDAYAVLYTQLLAEALFDERRSGSRPLPRRVFRGLRCFSEVHLRHYERLAADRGRVYFYAFTSTSADPTVALRFAQPSGWRFVIDIGSCAAECVASVAHLSEFDEQEVLISANAGFRVDSVSRPAKVVRITLVDEGQCLKRKPRSYCAKHR